MKKRLWVKIERWWRPLENCLQSETQSTAATLMSYTNIYREMDVVAVFVCTDEVRAHAHTRTFTRSLA